jgi:cytochrome c2
MMKASAVLGLVALILFAASFSPWLERSTLDSGAQKDAPDAEALAAEGRALFLAKGCATCHRHDDVGRQPGLVEVGPTLTNYQPDETFVRQWLRDPQAVRPATTMPNLGLAEQEIEALIAFLAES